MTDPNTAAIIKLFFLLYINIGTCVSIKCSCRIQTCVHWVCCYSHLQQSKKIYVCIQVVFNSIYDPLHSVVCTYPRGYMCINISNLLTAFF